MNDIGRDNKRIAPPQYFLVAIDADFKCTTFDMRYLAVVMMVQRPNTVCRKLDAHQHQPIVIRHNLAANPFADDFPSDVVVVYKNILSYVLSKSIPRILGYFQSRIVINHFIAVDVHQFSAAGDKNIAQIAL